MATDQPTNPQPTDDHCNDTTCHHWVTRFDEPTAETPDPNGPRIINNTDRPAKHPWPPGITIQGGFGWANSQRHHNEWFFEASLPGPPPSFLRTTGPSLPEAEDAAWRAWQAQLACPAAPEHGPFEARSYTNGSGWCTQCGYWFNRVLPPQPTTEPNNALQRLTQAAMHYNAATSPAPPQ